MSKLALKLNGTTSYTDIPNLNLLKNYTIEFAIKPYKLEGIIINNKNSFAIGFYNNNSFILSSINSNGSKIENIKLNEWNYISITYDENNIGDVYINGNKEKPIVNSYWTNSGNFIGKRDNGTFYNGEIDEIRIWNKIISEDKMLAYNQKKIKNTTEALIAYYTFDNKIPNKIINLVNNDESSSYNCIYSDGANIIMLYKYLLKQNNKYYTIKSDFYKNSNYESITELEGKEILTQNDFETYGIDNLNLLTEIMDTQVINGIDKGSLSSGKYFEIPFNNDFLSISEVK